MLTQHLVQVAAMGKTGKAPFIPMNEHQLVQTFKDIIGPETACDIVLNGKVKPGLECKGKLEINGKLLECGQRERLEAEGHEHHHGHGFSLHAVQDGRGGRAARGLPLWSLDAELIHTGWPRN